jgi:hypothetical protein
MRVEVKRFYIRDWHGRFAHVPGSSHALDTIKGGREKINGPVAEKQMVDDLAEEIGPDAAHSAVERLKMVGHVPTVYTNGSINIRIHPSVPESVHQKILLDVASLQHFAPVKDLDVRIDDDFVTHGSGQTLEHAATGCMGWTEVTAGNGNTTIAIRPTPWTRPKGPVQAGLLMRSSDGNRGRYFIAHEWGHATLRPSQRSAEMGARLMYFYQVHRYAGSMYAAESPDEYYAENFAEWHTTGGTTSNKVTQQMAMDFGWFMADQLPETAGLPKERWEKAA